MSTIIQPLARDVSDAVRSSQAVSSPAQAALELVYNALDAGATEVVVALDVGALSITVRDNGRGIAAAELALVGERHATSKLRALSRDGRVAVGTFGFRGEALHALGLVGQLEVVSRARRAAMFGDTLALPRCQEIVDALARCELPMRCAHGRPTVTALVDRL